MERATHAFGPVGVGIGRLIGGAAVLALVWGWQRGQHRLSGRDCLHIAGVALLGTALPFVVQPYCMAQGFGHSYFGMFVALTPLATLLIAIPMLGHLPAIRQVVGVIGGFLGMLLILQDGNHRGMPLNLLVLAATVPLSYAVGNTYIKWKLSHVHAVPLTTLLLGFAAAWLAPLLAMPGVLTQLGMAGPEIRRDWAVAISSLAILGAIGTGIAILLFIQLVQTRGPLFAGMVTYVVPLLALVWGAVDGETISLRQAMAIMVVLAMVALVQAGPARSEVSGDEPHACPAEIPAESPVHDAGG